MEASLEIIVHRLDKIDSDLTDIESRLRSIERSVWVLQTKAALIGAVAGMVPAMVVFFLKGG